MATNRAKIREQVQLLYGQFLKKNGFNDNIDSRVIDLHVEQFINKALKIQSLTNLKNGSVEIPTCNIAEYTIAASNNTVTLPTFPINLPLDMGVWNVSLASSPGDYLIPIAKGYSSVFKGTNAEYLEGQTGYIVKGNTISFTKAVSGNVVVELLVSDFSELSDTDLLPIPPDMEVDVISNVLDLISQGRYSQSELNSKDTVKNAN